MWGERTGFKTIRDLEVNKSQQSQWPESTSAAAFLQMEGSYSPPRRSQTVHTTASSPASPPRSQTLASSRSGGRILLGFALSPSTPRHILVPTTRLWPPPNTSVATRSPRPGTKVSKRHTSLDLTRSTSSGATTTLHEHAWLNHLSKLDVQVLESGIEMFGYQVFIVEQWFALRLSIPLRT